jgi:hypothetical protein
MGVCKQARTAIIGGATVAAAWAVVALAAPAQPQSYFPPAPTAGPTLTFAADKVAPVEKEPEVLPPMQMPPVNDPNVEPAQYKQPAKPPNAPGRPAAGAGPRPAGDVADPAYPVVTIRVRVPAHAAPGDDLKYVITVQNAWRRGSRRWSRPSRSRTTSSPPTSNWSGRSGR